MLYLWLCCRGRFATFGPQGEIDWTSLSASPDARAEGPPVTTEAAHCCPSTSLKKVRPYLIILWCCSKYKVFFQCWVGSAASGVRHLPGNWCQPESHWTPWTTVVMSCPRVLGHLCSQLSCPLLLLLWDSNSPRPFIPTLGCCICQNINSEMPVSKLCTLHNGFKNCWIYAGCFYPKFKS